MVVGVLLFYSSLHLRVEGMSLPFLRNLSIPVAIVMTKVTSCLALTLMTRGWQSSCDASDANEADDAKLHQSDGTEVSAEDEESIVPDGHVVSFRKAFVRLSFTMFLVSHFVIRLDFFSSRMLFSIFLYDTVST